MIMVRVRVRIPIRVNVAVRMRVVDGIMGLWYWGGTMQPLLIVIPAAPSKGLSLTLCTDTELVRVG